MNLKPGILTLTACAALTAASCTNGNLGSKTSPSSAGVNNSQTSAVTTVTPDSYTISVATISAPAGSSGSATSFSTVILLDGAKSAKDMGDHCTISGGNNSKPCQCTYSWTEQNTSTGTTVNIARTVNQPLTFIQPAKIECAAPDVYATEILAGTPIRITIKPAPGNSDVFTVVSYIFTKGGASASSDYLTSQGQTISNVMRYTCYEQYQKGLSIRNKFFNAQQTFNDPAPATTQTTRYSRFPLGTSFCLKPAGGGSTTFDSSTCDAMDFGYSAQSYYYSLYIREGEASTINPHNNNYVCPKIRQPLVPMATAAGEGKYWPLDSTFALSNSASGVFNVGVDAFTRLSASTSGDPNSVNSSCAGTLSSSSDSNANSFVRNCLGFAAMPNPDGGCANIKNSNGVDIPTYRLRRFVAIYPAIFNTNGFPMDGQAQATDTVYVLDRPVAGAPAGAHYTMQGPKPCPFAYFDRTGMTGTRRYASTNADGIDSNGDKIPDQFDGSGNPTHYTTGWLDKNIDGISFPSVDTATSCGTTFPVLKQDRSELALLTPQNGLTTYVRGTDPWSPHYEEDTSFRACAPQATPFRDPPLHFAKTPSFNVAWCAETYPTQNENLTSLLVAADPSMIGNFAPFTSHASKNTALSATCAASPPPGLPTATTGAAFPASYPATGLARHPAGLNDAKGNPMNLDKTCDRSAVADTTTFMTFPLLATADSTEKTLKSDESYQCQITYDGLPLSTTKVGKLTPSQGCCAAAVGITTGGATSSAMTAHLEPNVSCQPPAY